MSENKQFLLLISALFMVVVFAFTSPALAFYFWLFVCMPFSAYYLIKYNPFS